MAARATTTRKAIARKSSAKKKPVRKAVKTAKVKSNVKQAANKTAVKAKRAVSIAVKPIRERQTSAQIITQIAEKTDLSRADVKAVFTEMSNVIEAHIMARGSGEVPIPELGIKVKRHEKKAVKARMGRNPATGEAVKIAAKPKRKVVKVQVLKKLKEILDN